jgi:spore maturation protein CgeB
MMRIACFGSSLVSSYWNGAATYYRGLLAALARRGHAITFFEPDAFERQQHRDIETPDWVDLVVWPAHDAGLHFALDKARRGSFDVVIKFSGVGVFDRELEREIVRLKSARTAVLYWDVDAPATLDRMAADPEDPLLALIPQFDLVCTYGGGPPVIRAFRDLGASDCVPIYNGFDPATHYPVVADDRFAADLAFLGNRLPDREARVATFFLDPARRQPQRHFLLGGAGWTPEHLPPNVSYVGHVGTAMHNAFNCSPMAVMNISRSSMAAYGWSPATRIFEAAGSGACIVSDLWPGIEDFFEPGREILTVETEDDVIDLLQRLDRNKARCIGERARRRAVADHSYAARAVICENVLQGRCVAAA